MRCGDGVLSCTRSSRGQSVRAETTTAAGLIGFSTTTTHDITLLHVGSIH